MIVTNLKSEDITNKGFDVKKVVSSNAAFGEVYSIQHYVIKFVSDLRQIRFPSPIKLTGRFDWNIESDVKHHIPPIPYISLSYKNILVMLRAIRTYRSWPRGPMLGRTQNMPCCNLIVWYSLCYFGCGSQMCL